MKKLMDGGLTREEMRQIVFSALLAVCMIGCASTPCEVVVRRPEPLDPAMWNAELTIVLDDVSLPHAVAAVHKEWAKAVFPKKPPSIAIVGKIPGGYENEPRLSISASNATALTYLNIISDVTATHLRLNSSYVTFGYNEGRCIEPWVVLPLPLKPQAQQFFGITDNTSPEQLKATLTDLGIAFDQSWCEVSWHAESEWIVMLNTAIEHRKLAGIAALVSEGYRVTAIETQRARDALPSEQPDWSVMIGLKEFVLKASDEYAWAEPVYNFDNSVAFAVKHDWNHEGWAAHSVTRVTENGIEDPFISKDTLDNGIVRKIFNVSDDGRRLHIYLMFKKQPNEDDSFYGAYPAILDLDTLHAELADYLRSE